MGVQTQGQGNPTVSLVSEGEKYQISARGGPRITRMQTGSLPAASPSSTASTQSNTLSRRPHSLVIRVNYMYHSVSLSNFTHV